jgi:hypothetical protein
MKFLNFQRFAIFRQNFIKFSLVTTDVRYRKVKITKFPRRRWLENAVKVLIKIRNFNL